MILNIALLRGQYAQRLLHLGHRIALRYGCGLGTLQSRFQCRHMLGLLLGLGVEQLCLLSAGFTRNQQLLLVNQRLRAALSPLGALGLQHQKALFHALTAFHHVANFCLQAAHLGTGFIEQALALVHFVRSGVMRLAHLLEFGLDMAHLGHARFQCVDCRLCIALHFDLLGLRFGAAQKPNLVLLARHIGLHGLVLLRDLGLALQFFQTAIELAQNVFHPR